MPNEAVIRTTIVGPQDIGQGTSPQNAGRVLLKAYVPLIANITAIRAYIRNKPWGQGECSLGPSTWILAPLNGKEPMGWCRAEGRGQGSTEQAQWIAVEFFNWSNCNSREAKLEVDYELFQTFVDSSNPEKEIDESLWKHPSML